MKYHNSHYFESPRIFWPQDYKVEVDEKTKKNKYTTKEGDKYKKYHELSVYAKWLYQTLKECEHHYTGKKNKWETVVFEGIENAHGWFYAGNEKLAYLSGMSESSVRRAKDELIKAGLIITCKVFFTHNGKRTGQWCTGFYIPGEDFLRR